jgi:hypothetical protein
MSRPLRRSKVIPKTLPDSLFTKLKKYARVDGERRGIEVSDVTDEEALMLEEMGWEKRSVETVDASILCWWEPL